MSKPIQFIITILIHTDGEATFTEDEQTCYVKGIGINPIVDIIGDVTEEQRSLIQMMALHTVLGECYKKVKKTSMHDNLRSSTEIPSAPPKKGQAH